MLIPKLCAGIVSVVFDCPRIVALSHILYIGGDSMTTLKAYGDAVVGIFQLIGDKENNITKPTGKKDNSVYVKGNYSVRWNFCDEIKYDLNMI